MGDRTTAEDLTSEVFRQALAGLTRFEWRGAPFGAWLVRIARNTVADHFQRLARERSVPLPADPPDEVSEVEDAEERARLFRLVSRLPEEQRRVIVMRFTEEKSLRQVAGELGRSEGAVKQLQFRALKSLRARMSGSHG